MASVPSITLNNGEKMPSFGLGTYLVSDSCVFCHCVSNKIHLNQTESRISFQWIYILFVIQYRGGEAIAMIKKSIEIGYRNFDCAFLYSNEVEVGEGIRAKIADGTVTRQEMFIATKVHTQKGRKWKKMFGLRTLLSN